MWAVLYDDGTSLTTVSEPIAHSLAAAERQRGPHVTGRRAAAGRGTSLGAWTGHRSLTARADPGTRIGPHGQAYETPQTPALRAYRRQHPRRSRTGRSLGRAAQGRCHYQLQLDAGQRS